jgi:cytochrome c biogenesis protein CcmG/thiol:disulfide interchange protein DsbE
VGRRRERAVAHKALAALIVVAALTSSACFGTNSSGKDGAVGTTAPAFVTTDVNGHPVRLDDFAGHPVLVNFWASWCIPCRTEFPVLRSLLAQRSDVRVLGVVFNDSASAARSFLADQHATWPGLLDPKHQIADAYGVHEKPGIPVTVVVDANGKVQARHLGPLTSVDDATKLLATTPSES